MDHLEPTRLTCSRCGCDKPVSEFYRPPGRGFRADCRPCHNEYVKAWRHANPDKAKAIMRRHDLKRGYGITPEQHEDMLQFQAGKCLGCLGDISTGRGPLAPAVDHCHTTGKVRGLLCQPCNFTLGNVKDRPDTLRRLADYLENA